MSITFINIWCLLLFVFGLHTFYEMLYICIICIFYTKIVKDNREAYVLVLVFEISVRVAWFCVSVFGEVLDEIVVCNFTGLFECRQVLQQTGQCQSGTRAYNNPQKNPKNVSKKTNIKEICHVSPVSEQINSDRCLHFRVFWNPWGVSTNIIDIRKDRVLIIALFCV